MNPYLLVLETSALPFLSYCPVRERSGAGGVRTHLSRDQRFLFGSIPCHIVPRSIQAFALPHSKKALMSLGKASLRDGSEGIPTDLRGLILMPGSRPPLTLLLRGISRILAPRAFRDRGFLHLPDNHQSSMFLCACQAP